MQEHSLLQLLDPDAATRRAAIERVPGTDAGVHALRSALLADADASVRARAAERLGTLGKKRHGMDETMDETMDKGRLRQLCGWLEEATFDTHESVRHAAYQGLGRLGDRAAIPRLGQACAHEAVWSVRRAAVLALAAIAGVEAVPTLLAVLDDPFWRVRHAAIRALAVLGAGDEAVRERILAARPATQAAAWALEYLRRGFGGEVLPALEPRPGPEPVRRADASIDPAWDADPAVMAARFEDPGVTVSSALLLEAMADSHEPLRAMAIKRLRASGDMRTYRAALMWLDELRIPHAAQAVRAVLDDLGDTAHELAAEVLDPDGAAEHGAGARVWALSWARRTRSREFLDAALAHAAASEASVRAAALDALAELVTTYPGPECAEDGEAALACLVRGTRDPDMDVRLAGVRGLASLHMPGAYAALAAMSWADEPVAIRRVLVRAAAEHGDLARLCAVAGSPATPAEPAEDVEAARSRSQAPGDSDAWCRACAISVLDACGELDQELRAQAFADRDPWLRMAALDQDNALAALGVGMTAGDPDPQVARAALEWIATRCDDPDVRARAGLHCARAVDPWLRAHACACLDPEKDAELALLLGLSADTSAMVRAAAADRLGACADLDHRLGRILHEQKNDFVRKSAYTWLARKLDRASGELVARALTQGNESPAVVEHLRAMLIALPDIASATSWPSLKTALAQGAEKPAASAASPGHVTEVRLRSLGKTGIQVSPLAISGAFDLPAHALGQAQQRGVNLFFWEPRYAAMTRFLRTSPARRSGLVIAGGSFHGSPAAIEADVDSALKKLRTDYLDIFLLFWVRSLARLSDEIRSSVQRLKAKGKIRAAGFSTHDRAIAATALREHAWDVIMVRHSAAHRGAETGVFPLAAERGTGVLTFSALCYGRMLRVVPGTWREAVPTAADCYRYSLSQDGVTACISAPRRYAELIENLAVLDQPTLDQATIMALREHGQAVYDRNKDFNALVRREPKLDGRAAHAVDQSDTLNELLDELAPSSHF